MIKQLIQNYRAWLRRQDAMHQLENMGTRELADLGLRRCDIPYVVRGQPRSAAELHADYSSLSN
jgi:hypothetical protein